MTTATKSNKQFIFVNFFMVLFFMLCGTLFQFQPFLGKDLWVGRAFAASLDEQNQTLEQLKKDVEVLKKEDVSEEEKEKRSLTSKTLISLLAIFCGAIFFWILRFGIRRFEEFMSEKGVIRESAQTLRLKTLSKIFNWFGSVTIGLVIVYVILDMFGVNVAPLLAGAGIVGLAFGIGGQ